MMRKVLGDVAKERKRQDAKWGQQNHDPHMWMVILGEEFGEACKEAYEGSLRKLRTELIQTAAVAVAAVECLDRGEWELKWKEDPK